MTNKHKGSPGITAVSLRTQLFKCRLVFVFCFDMPAGTVLWRHVFGQFEAIFGRWRCRVDHLAAIVPRRIHVIAPRRVFLTWQHLVPTSFLRFMLFTSLAHFKIYSFSLVHKSHILSPGLNFLHSFTISHFKFGVGPQFLFHVNCDNAVLFRLVSVLKECLCWLNLLLKGSDVIPI